MSRRRLVKCNAHIGIKYPMAIDREKAQLIEARKIARWFYPCVSPGMSLSGTWFISCGEHKHVTHSHGLECVAW